MKTLAFRSAPWNFGLAALLVLSVPALTAQTAPNPTPTSPYNSTPTSPYNSTPSSPYSSPSSPGSTATIAAMQEDIQALQREVGQLRLRADSLEQDNAELKKRIPTSLEIKNMVENVVAASRAEVSKDLEKKIAQANDDSRKEILAEVAKEMKVFADETNAQLDKLAHAIGSTPTPHPTTVTSGPPRNYSNGFEYKVQKNESLTLIAKRNNVSVNDIRQASHLTSDSLREGQTIWIPKKEGAPSPAPSTSTVPPEGLTLGPISNGPSTSAK